MELGVGFVVDTAASFDVNTYFALLLSGVSWVNES
jgi:hypothetical protein